MIVEEKNEKQFFLVGNVGFGINVGNDGYWL